MLGYQIFLPKGCSQTDMAQATLGFFFFFFFFYEKAALNLGRDNKSKDRNFLKTGLYEILYNPYIRLTCVYWHVRITCFFDSAYFSHAFLIALIKKTCDSHMPMDT